jgi:hypothetical protein
VFIIESTFVVVSLMVSIVITIVVIVITTIGITAAVAASHGYCHQGSQKSKNQICVHGEVCLSLLNKETKGDVLSYWVGNPFIPGLIHWSICMPFICILVTMEYAKGDSY